MHGRPRTRLVAYGVAVLATAVCLLVRWPLWPVLGDAVPHMTFFLAVMLAAYYGGFWPGMLATLLGAVAANSFLTGQSRSFHIGHPVDMAALTLFVVTSTIISALCESLHRAQRRILAAERQRAEAALRETEERSRQLVENLHEIFWTMDAAGQRMLYISPGYEEVSGRTRQSLMEQPRSWLEAVHPDDRDMMLETVKQYRRGVFAEAEFRLVRPDSSIRWMRSRAFAINDPAGQVAHFAGLAEDITERKRAEEARRESEQRWRNLTEALPQFVWTARADGTADYFSTQITQYTGRAESDLLAWGWMDVLHPDDRERTRNSWIDAIAKQRDHEVEHRIRGSAGAYRWFTTRAVPIRDSAGHIVRWFGTCTDISEHKRSEQALRESEQRWRSLTEALPQLVWTATPDGSCDYFSTQWTQHTGVPESDLLGWRWLATLHPDDREPTRRFWLDSVAGHRSYDVEYRVRRQDGIYRWFKTRGLPIRDNNGSIVKWFGTCTDITDLRQAEEALRESEQRFRGTFDNAAVGIAHVAVTGRFLRVNEKYCSIIGYPHDELIQKTIRDITHPDELSGSAPRCWSVLEGQSPGPALEQRYVRKDGSIVWVELSASLQRDAAGNPAYSISVIQDISERKELEGELRRAIEAAEAASRAKDEFLANVSHEIRTPMNAILGMTELALDTPLSDDLRQCLNTVKSAADNLLRIINDLLDFSKIEAGKLELAPADFSLRKALGDTVRALAIRAHKKGLELVGDVQPDVPDALVGDAGRLGQVLINLVGNAVKFTDHGEVVVRVEKVSGGVVSGELSEAGSATTHHSPLTTHLRFAVSDTGIGIPKDKQESIFRAFEQEDTSTTRKYGGTGLGLTIASRLVALMGGQITVHSEPGRGSSFAFTACFGLQAQPAERATTPPPVVLRDLPVLIVDDNATNRHILDEWLRRWQMKPTAVGNGLAALDALWHGAACGRSHALVLLDARMPDVDGLALAAQIRQRTELSATRIILLTSGDRPGDLARSREVRVDAHMLKPVQQDELLETIYQVMSRSNGNTPPAAKPAERRTPAPTPAGAPLRILVAEDNEFNAQLLEQLLGRRGHRVRVANNGRAALALAEGGAFDLLLLDVHMPELDGFQVVKAVREREAAAGGHLPIIALTARSRKEDRERCLAAGMDSFLSKPIQAADLWAAIERVPRTNPPAGPPGQSLLDRRVLLAACGGDAAILQKICQAFRASLPDHLAAVQKALGKQDAPGLREAAHKLAGMVAAFSTAAGEVASELEDRAAQGQLEAAHPLVGQIETMAQELMRLVDGLSLDALHDLAANADGTDGGRDPAETVQG